MAIKRAGLKRPQAHFPVHATYREAYEYNCLTKKIYVKLYFQIYFIGSIYRRQFGDDATKINAGVIVPKMPIRTGHPFINSNTIPYNT